jgi:hypothetical protein
MYYLEILTSQVIPGSGEVSASNAGSGMAGGFPSFLRKAHGTYAFETGTNVRSDERAKKQRR